MAPIPIPKDGIGLEGVPHFDDAILKSQIDATETTQLKLSDASLANLIETAHKGVKISYFVGKPGSPNSVTYKEVTQTLDFRKLNAFGMTFRGDKKWPVHHQLQRVSSVWTQNQEWLESRKLDLESDPALKALQQSLAQHEKKKQSNTTVFVKDSSKLPPAKSGKQPAPKSTSVSFLKSHRAGLFDHRKASTRSMPASPSLGAIFPTSILPDEKMLKAEAIKTALIHLIAIRPVSQKFICSTLRCAQADLEQVLQKYGRPTRLDPSKLELSDRGYKELDVWKFDYKNQEDRQAATERAVKAYDRLRISREDKLWQLLLPNEERGKGKILSNLSLHGGPIQQVRTPRINVQGTDDTKDGGSGTETDSDNRKGRLAPGNTESVPRSRSQDPIKKQRVSEKEAQTRNLLSKKSKKVVSTVKIKDNKSKSRKEIKKVTTAAEVTVKSAEFVHDSDEDIEMEDAVTVGNAAPASRNATDSTSIVLAKPATKRLPSTRARSASIHKDAELKKPSVSEISLQRSSTAASTTDPDMKSSASRSFSYGSTYRQSDTSPGSTSMMRTVSHKRNTSSPMKPSPLGCSPPANASDLDNDKVTVNGTSSSTSPMMYSRQTKADTLSNKVSPMYNSDQGLKRKVNDLDSDIHNHGSVSVLKRPEKPEKRQHTVVNTPPTSDSSEAPSPRVSNATLHTAQRFKQLYNTYLKLHNELAGQDHPPPDQVGRIIKMRGRLVELKSEIYEAVEP